MKPDRELQAVSAKQELPTKSILNPFINITIANQTYTALLDTGASISCISEQLMQELRMKHINTNANQFVRSISGSFLKVIGETEINFIIDSCLLNNTFVVIKDINQKLILGQDFFHKYNVVIDFHNNCITLKGCFQTKFCENSTQNIASMSNTTTCQDRFDTTIKNNIDTSDHQSTEEKSLKSISKIDYLYFTKLLQDNAENCSPISSKNSDPMDELKINPELDNMQKQSLRVLLSSFRENFAFTSSELGSCSLVEVDIKTIDDVPVHRPPYRVSPKQLEIINTQVEEMLNNGVIRESKSAYASPVVLVQKPDQSWRFCVDYRKLNKKVITDSYPLPIIEDIIIYLSEARYFADLDLNSGYWQYQLCEKDKHKTAFVTPSGLYEFNVLPFGLKTSQAVFQRTMDKVLAGIKYKNAICYVDNILIWGKNFSEFQEALREVMSRLKKANLTLKPSKCSFGYDKISVLGHEISGNGVRPDNKKLQSLKSLKPPTNTKQVKSLLGLFSYYRKFINNFAELALPLTKLLKKGIKFSWTQRHQDAFDTIINYMNDPPILHFYSNDNHVLTRLYIDASGEALGACLMQGTDTMYPICYASRKLNDAEKKYSTTEKECLALVWSLNYFKHFLWGLKFQVVTDHKALCWLRDRKDMNGRLARWSLCIQSYEFDIMHCAGRDNVIADFLSRNPLNQDGEDQKPISYQEDGMQVYKIEVVKMKDEQLQDEFCKQWIDRIASSGHSVYKGFSIVNNILCKKARRSNTIRELVVIPKRLLQEVLHELHDDPWSGGHLGLAKTLAKFRANYFIKDAEKEIDQYVKSCILCQERKKTRQVAQLQPIAVTHVMEKVGIDLLGPFRKSLNGNKYVIVCVEYATRYAVCKAVPRATAEKISEFLIEEVFCRFGGVKEIVSDRGSVFTSRLVKETINYFGAKSRLTTAFHPATNGLVERFNRTLTQMLSMYVSADQRNWCSYVPLVCFAYNSSKQSSTRISPYMLMYAKEPLLRTDIIVNNDDSLSINDYTRRHNENNILINCAINNIKKAQIKQKASFDRKAKIRNFVPNQLVMVYTPRRVTDKSIKLCRLYKGPFQIIRRISTVNYAIRKLNNRRFRDIVHVNRLKAFHPRT